MGKIFEIRGVEVWSPSMGAATLFLGMVRYLESRVSLTSGLIEHESDTIDVDPQRLKVFLKVVCLSTNVGHDSIAMLLHGVFVHAVALLLCSRIDISELDELLPQDWYGEARSVAAERMHVVGENE